MTNAKRTLWAALALLLNGSMGARAAAANPAHTGFNAISLPATDWTYVTNGVGAYIEARPEYDAVPVTADLGGGTLSSAVGGLRARGNVFLCSQNCFLVELGPYVAATSGARIVVTAYEGTSPTGVFTRLLSATATATGGTDYVTVTNLNLSLVAGRYYMLGAAWSNSVTYYYKAGHPANTVWGATRHGYQAADWPVPTAFTNTTAVSNTWLYAQHIRTTTNGVLRLGGDRQFGTYSATNTATWLVNAGVWNPLWLTFRHRYAGNSLDANDGVYVSTNGTTYVRVLPFVNGAHWQTQRVDLVSAAASNGVLLTAQTRVRFRQAGEYSLLGGLGGSREIDDVRIFSEPDLHHTALSMPSSALLRGTGAAKTLQYNATVVTRGSDQATTRTVTNLYAIGGAGGFLWQTQLTWSVTLNPYAVATQSLVRNVTVPAAVRFTNMYHTYSMTLNRPISLREGDTNNNYAGLGKEGNHYSGVLHFKDVPTDIYITNWYAGSYPSYNLTNHTISGTGVVAGYAFAFTNLNVLKDLATFDYRIHPTNPAVIPVAVPGTNTLAGVDYHFDGLVRLSRDGAWGDVVVRLPPGAGLADAGDASILEPFIAFPNTALRATLHPHVCTNHTAQYLCEETKPLLFGVSRTVWTPDSGQFDFQGMGGDARYVRAEAMDWLDHFKPDMEDPDMAVKPSNEMFYRQIEKVGSDFQVRAAPATAGAWFAGELTYFAATNIPHFPRGPTNRWMGQAVMFVTNDLVVAGGVDIFRRFEVPYSKMCPGDDCGADVPPGTPRMGEEPETLFTANAGIVAHGALETAHRLEWGAFPGDYAQIADRFDTARFYMPGHFLRGGQHPSISSNFTPAVLLLAGLAKNGTLGERPGTAAYALGLDDYAGLNFRCEEVGGVMGRCVMGRTEAAVFPLKDRAKYYVRRSGVSGIQDAETGAFPPDATVFGYPLVFDNYGLSYLSNSNKESRTQGYVELGGPSSFKMEFEELTFSCLGDPLDAKVPDGVGDKKLVYWNAVITPHAFRFEYDPLASCANRDGYLTLGVATRCANVEQTLCGILGFRNDGNLLPRAEGPTNIDSRLTLPNRLDFKGPAGETYRLAPVCGAYYNNHDNEADPDAFGFITFAGSLDVAFFEDVLVQIQTSASTNVADAPLYLMGGWPSQGWKIFGKSYFDGVYFDDRNRGYPDTLASNQAYRDGGETYRPRALRTWLGIVDFDYPLNWSPTARSFTLYGTPPSYDFVVIRAQHQVDYLSAANASLSFGAQYDGLPSISLANLAFNAIDEATGVASAFVDAGLDTVRATVDRGLDEFDTLLSDTPDVLLDDLMAGVCDPLIDACYNALSNAWQAAGGGTGVDYYSAVLSNYIGKTSGLTTNTLKFRLQTMVGGSVSLPRAPNLLQQVTNSMLRGEQLLGAFCDQVSIDPETGEQLGEAVAGLLTEDLGRFGLLRDLGVSVIGELSGSLFDAIGATELGSGLNEALDAVRPALTTVRETMSDLNTTLTNLQGTLSLNASFGAELNLAVTGQVSELNAVATQALQRIRQRLLQIESQGGRFDEYTPDEIKALMREEIKNQLYGSAIAANLTSVLRSRVYELDSSARAACDSAFQQLNNAIRGILSSYLAGIDETISGALGDLADYLGSGQVDGYAHIKGDALTELRLDARLQLKAPDNIEFKGYLIIRELDSDGSDGCGRGPGEVANEVIVGAEDVGLGWISDGLRADVELKFAFQTEPDFKPVGLAGSFEVTGGLKFESFEIPELGAALAFGLDENYLSAHIRAILSSVEVAGGAFFGRTCTLDPLSWDEEVSEILGEPPFTGVYVYGEGWVPVVDYGCLFRIKAGAGAGVFYFVEGPTIGGKIMLGASGEAICVVDVRGEVRLVGLKQGDALRMSGKGKIKGKVGCCPFCVKFKKQVKFTYNNGSWSADY